MIKLAIVGSRDFDDFARLNKEILSNFNIRDIELIVSGRCRGADMLGEMFAELYGIPTKIFPADWNKWGKSAGFRRNKDIIEASTDVIAFHKNASKGTAHSIQLAREQKKNLIVIEV